ncbi:hypothetical protein V6N12_046303 [Hibiscus sabdariffa]|uniref:RNase H type-1 domain-containing protein n=1 Tax=Hibiscus sabdariffa TaxID=183260 RepID=A0ABR1ZDS0_9ROSI
MRMSFSIRSAYESLASSTWDNKSSYWKWFWSLPVPQRLRLFIWLSYKERLMTNVERCRRSFRQSLARYYTESCVLKEHASPGTALTPHAHWKRLDEGWVCLNTDGGVSSSTGYGSVGGIFRTHDGSWLLGFNKWVGVTQSLQSELWAIFYGLQIARDNGFDHLLIQTDCLEAVTQLNAPSAGSDVNALVRAIVRMRNTGWVTIVRWIPRVEINSPMQWPNLMQPMILLFLLQLQCLWSLT